MKPLDRWLQRRRIAQAARFLTPDSRVLDVGCADGALFRELKITDGLGLDPDLSVRREVGAVPLLPGRFPQDVPATAPFDAITLLAVLEHIPGAQLTALAAASFRLLKPKGRLIITVPSARVDRLLAVLKSLRLIDGMALEEHHGFDPAQTPAIFTPAGFRLHRHHTFQLGLNNLFVFRKPG